MGLTIDAPAGLGRAQEAGAEVADDPAAGGATDSAARRPARGAAFVFTAAAFVAAALVFLVQPMVAKLILPRLGGSPAVWNTSLVFFQGLLLVGYGYAHLSTRWLPMRRQAQAHLVVLALPLLVLPFSLPGWEPPTRGPVSFWLLGLLFVVAGLPYAVITTASPLLQRWFSTTGHRAAHDPYFLYAAGNVGSLLGLIAYPVVVEPNLSLPQQARLWAGGYLAFIALSVGASVWVRGNRAARAIAADAVGSPALAWRTRLRWVAFAFLPSSLLIGATTHLTVDIAAVPLLWVIPLSLYLLSFVVAFSRLSPAATRIANTALPVLIVMIVTRAFTGFLSRVGVEIALHLGTLFVAAVLCHGRLADERPPADRLTEFYLLLSIGGVLGGIFNALVAPLVFDTPLEYSIVLGAVLLARIHRAGKRLALVDVGLVAAAYFATGWLADNHGAWFGYVLALVVLSRQRRPLAAALILGMTLYVAETRAREGFESTDRSFFGTLSVYRDGDFRVLSHGTTLHGQQLLDSPYKDEPGSYYARSGPIGQAFAALDADTRVQRVGVVGLGVGTLAAYNKTGRHLTFFEIDKAVHRYASDRRWFTFLPTAQGTVDVVFGDARLSLRKQPAATFGMLALDAFSSDAIPVHLLTREAIEDYLRVLQPEGILMVHISNRYLDLEPVLAATARSLGIQAWVWDDFEVSAEDEEIGKATSQWVALARTDAALDVLRGRGGWTPAVARADVKGWTDQSSNLWSVLHLW